MTENEFASGRGFDAEPLGADGYAAVWSDFDGDAFTPDKGPPGTARDGTQGGAAFFQGGVPRLLGFHLEFAMHLVLVAVAAQVLDVGIGLVEVLDAFAGEVSGEAVLPELVFAFDLAFGLGRGRVAKAHAVEAQRLAELGEGVGDVGEEEGVEVHVELEGQAVFEEGGGEEVEVGEEGFARVEFGAGEHPAAIVEHVEHGEEELGVGKPAVGRGVELPEFADLGALPAADRGGQVGVGFGVSQMVFEGPAADLGAVEGEVAQAQDFAGGEAVGGGGLGGEAFGEQGEDFGRPGRRVIAAGEAGPPDGVALRTGAQVVAVEFVEATAGELQLGGRGVDVEFLSAEAGQDVPDQRWGQAIEELWLFIGGV